MPKVPEWTRTTTPPPTPFWRHYTFYYDWVRTEESPLARFEWPGGTLVLSPAFLKVCQSEQEQWFRLRDLNTIHYLRRHLWFPLISGGILTPFALVLTLTNVLPLWWGIGLVLGGLLWGFYGWQGQYQLELWRGNQVSRYVVPPEDAELEGFLREVGKIRKKQTSASTLKLPLL